MTTTSHFARTQHHEAHLRQKLLPAWHEVMFNWASEATLLADRATLAIDAGAFQMATASTIANIINGMAMTFSKGNAQKATAMQAAILADVQKLCTLYLARIAQGDGLENITTTIVRNGKEVPFDFRDHLSTTGRTEAS